MKNKFDHLDFSEKVLAGTKIALQKLVEERAAQNKSLIVKIDGEVKRVPARDLLKNMSK